MRAFWRKGEQRTIPEGGAVWNEGTWPPQFPPAPGDALQVADIFACIRCLSDAASSVPLIAYRRASSGRQRLESGRLPELLRKPAPGVTGPNLIGLMMAHLAGWGNSYVGKF